MPEGIKEAYDLWHQKHALEAQRSQEHLHPWHRVVARRLPDLSDLRVLEIGCGRGDFSIWLAGEYPRARITGVDFSGKAIAMAKERSDRMRANVTFCVDDAEHLQIESNTYDWVISCECLEHVPQPQQMAAEIRRVLKPSGRFVLTTENYFNGMVLGWIMAWWRRQPFDSGSGPQPHENFFLFWRVRRLLEAAGLQVEHMESSHYQWLLLPRCAPHRLCTEDFKTPALKRLFRPFGRHFEFEGSRIAPSH